MFRFFLKVILRNLFITDPNEGTKGGAAASFIENILFCDGMVNNNDRLLSTFFKAMTAAFPVTVSRKTMQTAYLVRSSDTQTLLINNNWRNLTNN